MTSNSSASTRIEPLRDRFWRGVGLDQHSVQSVPLCLILSRREQLVGLRRQRFAVRGLRPWYAVGSQKQFLLVRIGFVRSRAKYVEKTERGRGVTAMSQLTDDVVPAN